MLQTMSDELDGLSANELEEYKEIFALFDSDGKGYITQVKLGQVMRNFRWDPSESILQVTVRDIFIEFRLNFVCFNTLCSNICILLLPISGDDERS